MNKFEIGDKIKCIDPTCLLTFNKVYKVLEIDDFDVWIINDDDNGIPTSYQPSRFVLAEKKDTKTRIIDLARAAIGNRRFEITQLCGGDLIVVRLDECYVADINELDFGFHATKIEEAERILNL